MPTDQEEHTSPWHQKYDRDPSKILRKGQQSLCMLQNFQRLRVLYSHLTLSQTLHRTRRGSNQKRAQDAMTLFGPQSNAYASL